MENFIYKTFKAEFLFFEFLMSINHRVAMKCLSPTLLLISLKRQLSKDWIVPSYSSRPGNKHESNPDSNGIRSN